MPTKLIQLEQRITELEKLADEVAQLGARQAHAENVQPELSTKGERWYRGARELLAQHGFSGLQQFDSCYQVGISCFIHKRLPDFLSAVADDHEDFSRFFMQARAILASVGEEIKSRELPVKSQLSFALSADEFDTSLDVFNAADGAEAVLRAAGVVARVALERHLFTVADSRSIPVQVNPPTKHKAGAEDVITTLSKAGVITAIQQSELQTLFSIGNNCAHPKEVVKADDVKSLISRGRHLASVIL